MSVASRPDRPPAILLLLAFGCVYFIWGGTFLAMRFAIETIPPFIMAGCRFLSAGAVLYAALRLSGTAPPARPQWPPAIVTGAMLLLGGNGLVVWSEQHVSSGLTAVLIATIPMWMVLIDGLLFGGRRPGPGTVLGLLLGFAGITLLVDPSDLSGSGVRPVNAAILMLAAISWSSGSLGSRSPRLPSSPMMATAMQLLAGGALLVVASLIAGEWRTFDPAAVSRRSFLSLAFLSLFGSIIAYTAYVWLLRVSTPARVSTYAYVNPVVALFAGWAFADEPVTPRTLLAAGVILASVVIVTTRPRGDEKARETGSGIGPGELEADERA